LNTPAAVSTPQPGDLPALYDQPAADTASALAAALDAMLG